MSDFMTGETLTVRDLESGDAPELAAMLGAQSPAYARFFHPFGFDEETLREVLGGRRSDVYTGMYWGGRLIGFFMLRGWDQGFEVPAFGILIHEKYRGAGLEMISLDVAKVICRLRGAPRMMLKMHPENITAKALARKIGFTQTGTEAENGNLIYHFDFTASGKTQAETNGQRNKPPTNPIS